MFAILLIRWLSFRHARGDTKAPRMSAVKQPGDRVRIPAEDVVGVVVKVGIGLSSGDTSGQEIIEVKVGKDEIRRYFANACEVIARGESDKETAAGDGGTLQPAAGSDITILPGGDTIETAVDDLLNDAELERLTNPDSEIGNRDESAEA